MRTHHLRTLLISLLLPLTTAHGVVEDITWTGGAGSWSTASSWTPAKVPNNNGGATYRVLIDGGSDDTASAVDLNTAVTIDELALDAGDELTLSSSGTLTLEVGADIVGTLRLDEDLGTTVDSTLRIGADIALDGGGEILMTEEADSVITSTSPTYRLTNRCRVHGEGKIGLNTMWLTNEDQVEATTGTLEIDPAAGAGGLVNSGLLRADGPSATLFLKAGDYDNTAGAIEATNGGAVVFASDVSMDNVGGQVRVLDGSEIRFQGPAITGGTIGAPGTGTCRTTTSGTTVFTDLTLTSLLQIDADSLLELSGTVTNVEGIVFENAVYTTSDSTLRINGDVTLAGGPVTLTEDNDSLLTGATGSSRLVNEGRLEGRGQLGANNLLITNLSTIEADAPGGTLVIDPSPGVGGLINQGTMRADGGGTLSLKSGDYENTGGMIEARAGSAVELGSDRIHGGTLSTQDDGVIRTTAITGILEDVELSGDLAVGTTHTLRLKNMLTNNGTLTLVENIGSTFDSVLMIDGDCVLEGSGQVAMTEALDSIIISAHAADRLTNRSNLRGQGLIGLNTMLLTNEGTIEATTGTVEIDPISAAGATADVVNTGALKATGADAVLRLRAGSYDNTSGTIEASSGGLLRFDSVAVVSNATSVVRALDTARIEFRDATLVGGVLTGSVEAVSGTTLFEDVSCDGSLEIRTSATLAASGQLTNDGLVRFQDDAGSTANSVLRINGDVLVNGAGTIEMTEAMDSQIMGLSSSDRLTNRGLIVGEGQIGLNSMLLSNEATIKATTGVIELDPYGGGGETADMVNRGTIAAEGPVATLRLRAGEYDNAGGLIEASAQGATILEPGADVLNTGGVIRAQDGSEVQFKSASVTGGAVESHGSGLLRVTGGGETSFEDASLQGELQIDAASVVELRGGLTNNGRVTFENHAGTTSDSTLRISGDVLLHGPGTLAMTEAYDSMITGSNASDRLTSHNRIEGTGLVGANYMTLTNTGTVDANVSGSMLYVDPSTGADGVINTGILQASNGGTLGLRNGNFSNSGGTIQALNASAVELRCDLITGGELATEGTGLFETTATMTTLEDLTLAGRLNVSAGHTLTLRGTVTNRGMLELVEHLGTTIDAVARIDGDTILEGTGTLLLTERNDSIVRGSASSDRLTNRCTIRGQGSLGQNYMTLVNEGTIRADGAQSIYIDLTAPSESSGSLEAVGAGGIEFREAVTTSGAAEIAVGSRITVQGDYTQTAGMTTVDGLLDPTGAVILSGGVLGGSGAVDAAVESSGDVAPGSSAGTLAVSGAYTQLAGGALSIEIGGLADVDYDRLAVGGTATLGGELTISVVGGFQPQTGQTFTILTASAVSGAFATENLPAIGGGDRTFKVSYGETFVVVQVVALTGESYEEWKEDSFTPAEQADPLVSGPDADPDEDGIPNAMEYGCGLDPKSPDLTPVRIGTIADGGLTYATLTYPASTGAADAVFGVRSSPDQASWSVKAVEEIARIPGGGVDEVTVKILTPTDALPIQFYQLTLELN